MKNIWLAASLFVFPLIASADAGPVLDALQVVRVYTGDTTDRIFVQFSAASMPGCYSDSGGRLYKADPFFDQLYSQILLLMANGGVKGGVVFENEGGPGWSVCRIKGLDLRP